MPRIFHTKPKRITGGMATAKQRGIANHIREKWALVDTKLKREFLAYLNTNVLHKSHGLDIRHPDVDVDTDGFPNADDWYYIVSAENEADADARVTEVMERLGQTPMDERPEWKKETEKIRAKREEREGKILGQKLLERRREERLQREKEEARAAAAAAAEADAALQGFVEANESEEEIKAELFNKYVDEHKGYTTPQLKEYLKILSRDIEGKIPNAETIADAIMFILQQRTNEEREKVAKAGEEAAKAMERNLAARAKEAQAKREEDEAIAAAEAERETLKAAHYKLLKDKNVLEAREIALLRQSAAQRRRIVESKKRYVTVSSLYNEAVLEKAKAAAALMRMGEKKMEAIIPMATAKLAKAQEEVLRTHAEKAQAFDAFEEEQSSIAAAEAANTEEVSRLNDDLEALFKVIKANETSNRELFARNPKAAALEGRIRRLKEEQEPILKKKAILKSLKKQYQQSLDAMNTVGGIRFWAHRLESIASLSDAERTQFIGEMSKFVAAYKSDTGALVKCEASITDALEEEANLMESILRLLEQQTDVMFAKKSGKGRYSGSGIWDSVKNFFSPKSAAPPPQPNPESYTGGLPPRAILQQISTQSYKPVADEQVGTLYLMRQTPTLKFYKAPDDSIVVGIRGTVPTDAGDLKADALIALNKLETSNRFKTDLATIQSFQRQWPMSKYKYYGVGHSLGGAILDSFLDMGLINKGVSYNPAVQPKNFTKMAGANERIYAKNDPLYAVMGRQLTEKPELRDVRDKTTFEKALDYVPYVGKVYDSYQGHMLDQFEGGRRLKVKGGMDELTAFPTRGVSDSGRSVRDKVLQTQSQLAINALTGVGPMPSANAIEQGLRNAGVKRYEIDPRTGLAVDEWGLTPKSGNSSPKSGNSSPRGVQVAPAPIEQIRRMGQSARKLDNEMTQKIEAAMEAAEPDEPKEDGEPWTTRWRKCLFGCGKGGKFETQLRKAGLEPSAYLAEAKRRAKKNHYPYKLLGFASDGVHKLAIPDENGRVVAFGKVGYGDHLIYSHMEAAGTVTSGTAEKKQKTFQKSHLKIKGDWQKNPFSPNNLALKILW